MGIEDPEAKCKPSKGRLWLETSNKGELHSKTFIKAVEQLGERIEWKGPVKEGRSEEGQGEVSVRSKGWGWGEAREGSGAKGRGQGEAPPFRSTFKGCEKQVPDLRGGFPRRG